MTEDLVEKIKYICKEDGEKFSKGDHLVLGLVKLKYYCNKDIKSERIRVIEGQEKVFDYVKLKKYSRFEWVGESNWEKAVEERYSQLKREF